MSSLQTIFIYQNAKGNVTGRVISDISETETYLQGFCHQANGLRTFRKDRILEMLNSSEEIQSKLSNTLVNNFSILTLRVTQGGDRLQHVRTHFLRNL